MHRKASLLAGLLCLSLTNSWCETPPADVASRTVASGDRVQAASAQTKDGGINLQAEYDLGEQQPVSAASGGLGAYAIAQAGLFYTSNPSLSSNGGRGDMYFMAQGGAGIHPNLIGGLYLDGHVSEQVYQYSHFSNLNFNRFNVGGGLDYVFESLGQLTASVRYDYERYLDGRNFNEFYVNNAVSVALSKQFILSDTQSIQAGWQGSFSVSAQPTEARRDSYDWWVGWHWHIVQPLELQTYYVFSIYNYVNEGRVDATQNVGGSLTYSFTDWASVAASANFGANNSTDSFFDYTVVNIGGAVNLDFRF